MLDTLDPLIAELHTYTGGLLWIFVLCTVLSAGATQTIRDLERTHRKATGRTKPIGMPHILRGVSTLSGLASAPLARRALVELPRVSETGQKLQDLSSVVPSYYIACLIGFLTGFFLTSSIWLLKLAVGKWNPEAAKAIPDLTAPTEGIELSREESHQLGRDRE